MALPLVLTRYRPLIDSALRSELAAYPSALYGMLRYHLGWLDERGRPVAGWAGKALRPALCLLACEALAGDWRPALPAAVALELLHNASLIHDDIQDGDRERRHRPTVWALWGQAQALNAGNAMASISTLSLQRLEDAGVPVERRLRAHRLLYETCLRLVEGQCLDIGFEGHLGVTMAEYLAMIERKTAASIASALEMGALLAGAGEATLTALRRCGRCLGLAFQISDDLLGTYGDEGKTGKPVGADIRRRKKTYPVVYAMEQAGGRAARRLADAYAAPPGQDEGLADVMAILDAVGARAKTAHEVQTHCEHAVRALDGLPIPVWAREGLSETARYLAQREV